MIRRLLDPTLGAKLRAVLRAVLALGVIPAAYSAHSDALVAVLVAAQPLLALLVAAPTPEG